MSADTPNAENGFNTVNPITDSPKNFFEPQYTALGAPLQRLSDGSLTTDTAITDKNNSDSSVDATTGMAESANKGIFSSFHPPDPVYGDEHSGIIPVDIAAHAALKAINAIEATTVKTFDSTVNHVSETTKLWLDRAKTSWTSSDNSLRQNINDIAYHLIKGSHTVSDYVVKNPTVIEISERAKEQTEKIQRGIERLQNETEALIDRIDGQTYLKSSTSHKLATGTGSSGTGVSSTQEQPDLTTAPYTSENIYAQSGYAPSSVTANSILGAAKGNCTWFVNGRADEMGGNDAQIDALSGMAYNWDDQARAAGITVSDKPQEGMISIAQWETGHVALVEENNGDGTIDISESSYDPGGSVDYLYNTRTISIDNPDRYILISKDSAQSITGSDSSESAWLEGGSTVGTTKTPVSTGQEFSIDNKNYQWVPLAIQSGNTLSQIALDVTGSTANYSLIADHNSIANPNFIRAGQVIEVPQEVAISTQVEVAENLAQATQAEVGNHFPLNGDSELLMIDGQQYTLSQYTIQAGDTLSEIALQTTGNASNYTLIAEHNGITNPNQISIGQQIKVAIPSREIIISPRNDENRPLDSSDTQLGLEVAPPVVTEQPINTVLNLVITPENEPGLNTDISSASITATSTDKLSLEKDRKFKVVNSNQTLSPYEVPKNAVDTIKSWFSNQEAETVYVTSNGLVLDNYHTVQNSDSSVTVNTTIFNRFVFDGLVQIYDKNGKFVRFADGVIEGTKAPENLVEGAIDLSSLQTEAFGRNLIDIRNNIKSSEISFTLKPGEYADIAIDSTETLLYNTLISVFDGYGLFADLKKQDLPSDEIGHFTLEFLKDLSSEGGATIASDSLLTILTSNESLEDKLTSEPVRNLLMKFLTYTIETREEALKSELSKYASELIEEGIGLLSPPVKRLSKITYGATKTVNLLMRLNNLRDICLNSIDSTRLELHEETTEQ